MPPTPDAVRAQLDRLLAADAFTGAGRLSRLLRYLVERTLAGDGDTLKEYTLGLDVFDRPDSYDPRHDSIVRVEARRLRARLDEYYRGPGALDPIVIDIPRGSYVPLFRAAEPASAAVPVAHAAGLAAASAAPRPARHVAIVATATAVLAMAVTAAIWPRPAATTAEASTSPSIAVLPFEHFSTQPTDALLAARLTDAVTTELARLGTLAVASRTSAARYAGKKLPTPEIARALDVAIIMEATTRVEGGTVFVEARLVDVDIDRKVWVGSFEGDPARTPELARRIAAGAASAIFERLRKRP